MPTALLLVEDEKSIADSVIYTFGKEGYAVTWVSLASEALAQITALNPALIIMDIGLPDMLGLDLCREVRKTSNTPIIFLTARSDEIDKILGLELGADDYVVKPFSPRELVARAKAVLRRQSNLVLAPDKTKKFKIDDAKKRITIYEKDLELSKYEYDLLKHLIARPGRVYSRDELLTLAFGNDHVTTDRAIDAHIKNIRAKIKSVDPETDPIETHRGLGYSLKEEF
ncbi:two-component system response regulator CreB [bacterium]|nr:two-component system response regulator CreB [bacterium]